MSFEADRIAQERHDLIQRAAAKRFAVFNGQPTNREVVELINAAIGEVDSSDGELVYDFNIEDTP
jgi:hypothetical protein